MNRCSYKIPIKKHSLLIIVIAISIIFMPINGVFAGNPQVDNDLLLEIPTDIDGIKCDEVEHFFFHTHTLLIINNQSNSYEIPSNIGIIPTKCLFWLHTHDNSGIIHVESPINSTFTVNDFLKIWNKFDNSSIVKKLLDKNINTKTQILFENNTIATQDNYLATELKDNSVITINIQQ